MWRTAGLAAILVCVAAPLFVGTWQLPCRTPPLTAARDAARHAARRQLHKLPDTDGISMSVAVMAHQVRCTSQARTDRLLLVHTLEQARPAAAAPTRLLLVSMV